MSEGASQITCEEFQRRLCELTLPSECASLSPAGLRAIHPRSSRGAGMWKSALSISKVCGKDGKKQFDRFSHPFHGPAFPSLLRL